MTTYTSQHLESADAADTLQDGRRPWLTIALCFAVAVLEGIDFQAPGIAAPGMAAAFGFDKLHMGWVFSAGILGLLPGALVGGWLSDRIGRRKVLADGQRLAKLSWSNRVRALAHEVVHLAEFALADWSCKTPHYWLMEGFAEWGALTIVDRLGLENFTAAVESLRRTARGEHGAELPRLDTLDTEAGWTAAEQSVDRKVVYAESFLALDFLIARKGLAAVADYFARFRDSAGRSDNFAAAFGEDADTFAAEFAAHLKKLL